MRTDLQICSAVEQVYNSCVYSICICCCEIQTRLLHTVTSRICSAGGVMYRTYCDAPISNSALTLFACLFGLLVVVGVFFLSPSSWPLKWREQLFPLKERNYRCAEVQLCYQHRQRQLCSCAHPYNQPENKLRSWSLQNKWSLLSNFFFFFPSVQANYRPWFEAALSYFYYYFYYFVGFWFGFFFATDLRDYWNSISARVITLKCRAEQFGGSMYWRFCSIMSLATGLGEVSSSGSLQ